MKKLSLTFLTFFAVTVIHAQTEVTFYTSEGRFVVEIYDNIVPITGGNFLTLVDQKFYDGIIFHRVINNFMIQGGDPTGIGNGGSAYIQDEFNASLSNVQKTISMANKGTPNTGGSQFFINLVDNIRLDFNKAPLTSKHPVFGKVIMNFNIVKKIGLVPTSASDRPITDVVMDSIRRGNGLTVGIKGFNSRSISAHIYPNPVNNNSVISITADKESIAEIIIYDAIGKIQTVQSTNLNSGINNIPISSLLDINSSKGIYHFKISIDNEYESISALIP